MRTRPRLRWENSRISAPPLAPKLCATTLSLSFPAQPGSDDAPHFAVSSLALCPGSDPERHPGLHLHGSLSLRLGQAASALSLPDACLNGLAAALAQVIDHVVLGTRSFDPTTYFLRGPSGWPLLEFLRMNDNVRLAALFDGEGESTVCQVSGLQRAVDAFLQDLFRQASLLRSAPDSVSAEDFFATRCDAFLCTRAARGQPVRLQEAAGPSGIPDANAPRVICIRIADMEGSPVPGSVRARCQRCASPVWISRSSRVMIEETSNPLFCIQCATAGEPDSVEEPRPAG